MKITVLELLSKKYLILSVISCEALLKDNDALHFKLMLGTSFNQEQKKRRGGREQ